MIFSTISIQVPYDGMFEVIFFKTMYNKIVIRFGFSVILDNQGLSKCYQPRPSARLITFDYSGCHKNLIQLLLLLLANQVTSLALLLRT